jgi:hypothetical protein
MVFIWPVVFYRYMVYIGTINPRYAGSGKEDDRKILCKDQISSVYIFGDKHDVNE